MVWSAFYVPRCRTEPFAQCRSGTSLALHCPRCPCARSHAGRVPLTRSPRQATSERQPMSQPPQPCESAGDVARGGGHGARFTFYPEAGARGRAARMGESNGHARGAVAMRSAARWRPPSCGRCAITKRALTEVPGCPFYFLFVCYVWAHGTGFRIELQDWRVTVTYHPLA